MNKNTTLMRCTEGETHTHTQWILCKLSVKTFHIFCFTRMKMLVVFWKKEEKEKKTRKNKAKTWALAHKPGYFTWINKHCLLHKLCVCVWRQAMAIIPKIQCIVCTLCSSGRNRVVARCNSSNSRFIKRTYSAFR